MDVLVNITRNFWVLNTYVHDNWIKTFDECLLNRGTVSSEVSGIVTTLRCRENASKFDCSFSNAGFIPPQIFGYNQPKKKLTQFETNSGQKTSFNATSIEKTQKCPLCDLELYSFSHAGLQSGLSEEISPQFGGGLRFRYNEPKKKLTQLETNSGQKTSFNAKRVLPTNLVLKVVVVFIMMNLFFGGANGSVSLEPLQECVENNGDFLIRCTINKEEENVYTWRQNTTTLFKDGKRHKNIDEEKYEEMTKGNSSTLIIKNFTEDDRNSIIHCYNGFLHTKLNLTNLNLTCNREDKNNKEEENNKVLYGVLGAVGCIILGVGVIFICKKCKRELAGGNENENIHITANERPNPETAEKMLEQNLDEDTPPDIYDSATRVKWSSEETKELLEIFKENLETGVTPGVDQCTKAIQNSQFLKQRSLETIKKKVWNLIQKRK